MESSDVWLVVLAIVFVGFVIWIFYTGKFDSLVGSRIDGVWDSLQELVRPVLRR